jgi:hypothetical protein
VTVAAPGGAGARRALAAALCLAVALPALGLSPALAAAKTLYARGGGGNTGASCAEGDECNLGKAVELAGEGDSIVLVPGPDFTPTKPLFIEGRIDIGGEPGKPRPTIVSPPGSFEFLIVDAHAHDLNLDFRGTGIVMERASADRISAVASGPGSIGCFLQEAVLTDSVCLAREGIGVESKSPGGTASSVRNVDAVGDEAGLLLFGAGAGHTARLEATNTIAMGGADPSDVDVRTFSAGSTPDEAVIDLQSSDFDTFHETLGGSITAPGTAGNITAPPLFANLPAGDLHQLPESPTVDAGLTNLGNGELDLDRNPRALLGHPGCGSTSAAGPTDIGAYELVPSRPDCSTPPAKEAAPQAAPPPPAAPPGTTLRKAKIDRGKGSATFVFAGTGAVSGFACELTGPPPKPAKGARKPKRRKPKFAACRSPKAYRHLKPGRYVFEVEAIGPGGRDRTPARRRFGIPTRRDQPYSGVLDEAAVAE